jgi:thymidylate synthase (FAD)
VENFTGSESIMEVELIDKMGSDLTVVNAARVSFGKNKEMFEASDEKLISFLAKHNHWSPFAHCSVQFRIKAPIFVARQLVKHQVGLSWNEISRRYVDYEPEYYIPTLFRKRAKDKKQGSSNETIEYDIADTIKNANTTYNDMLDKGIAPELARMVLPQNMMTEWYWTGSLYAFARVCELRCAEDTQEETRIIANSIDVFCNEEFPYSWKYLRNRD